MAEPTNTEIASALDELGDLYELDGAVIHRIVAYRNAAKAVRDASVSVTALAREGRATELPGIGAIIQEKVLALADDGDIPAAVKLRAKFPVGLLEITRLPGLAPTRARRPCEHLSVDSPQALGAAASAHQIRTLKGLGPKAEESIPAAITARSAERPPATARLPRRTASPAPVGEQPWTLRAIRPADMSSSPLRPPVDRQRQGPRHHRHRLRSPGAGPGRGGPGAGGDGADAERVRRAPALPHRAQGRRAHRRP
jgi:hypothetical protein